MKTTNETMDELKELYAARDRATEATEYDELSAKIGAIEKARTLKANRDRLLAEAEAEEIKEKLQAKRKKALAAVADLTAKLSQADAVLVEILGDLRKLQDQRAHIAGKIRSETEKTNQAGRELGLKPMSMPETGFLGTNVELDEIERRFDNHYLLLAKWRAEGKQVPEFPEPAWLLWNNISVLGSGEVEKA